MPPLSHFMVAAAFLCPNRPALSDSNPQAIAGEPFTGPKSSFAYNTKVRRKVVLAALQATCPPFLGPRKDNLHGDTHANHAAADVARANARANFCTRTSKDNSHSAACRRHAEVELPRQRPD